MAVLTTSGLLAVATPTDAQATAAPCAGRKVKTLTFATGSVQIYKRRGYVCAVTLPKKPGTKWHMRVSVKVWAFRPVVDQGRYAYRAGPVTVHAGKRSVWVEGAVGRASVDSGRWIGF
jgi:hypothetical protein